MNFEKGLEKTFLWYLKNEDITNLYLKKILLKDWKI